MILSRIIRLIKYNILLTVLIVFGLAYLLSSFIWSSDYSSMVKLDSIKLQENRLSFKWDLELHASNTTPSSCRNSVQGKVLLADDRGYICDRSEILDNGCCNRNDDETQRYVCDTCQKSGCCSVFEHCVSCCLHPNKKRVLLRVLSRVVDKSPVYSSVTDQFELCLVKCRTSSQSVLHETLYKDPEAKFCYSEGPLPLRNNAT